METQHNRVVTQTGSHNSVFSQGSARLEDASLSGQFRPMPLSWLVSWLFRPRAGAAQSEPEPFDEHMNGLA